MSQNQDCYGAEVNGKELFQVLGKILESNLIFEAQSGRRPTPICIWGTHGLGKTEIAMELARSKKWKIAYCAPAQFEEMGDLHGLPFKITPTPLFLVMKEQYTFPLNGFQPMRDREFYF